MGVGGGSGMDKINTQLMKPAPDLGRIGRLAENLRCAGRAVTDGMIKTPGGDAYEYCGSTSSVEWLIEALNDLEHFQAGWVK